MKRSWKHICVAAACALSLLLGGCSLTNRKAANTLTADESGSLTQTIVEQMDEEISEDDLKAYINEKISAYNDANDAESISLRSCKISSSEARIEIVYKTCDDYSAFNHMECFLGTISEAKEQGYTFDTALIDGKGEKADNETISERANEWMVMIVEEPMNVKVYDKVLYTTDNAKITGRLTAAANLKQATGQASDDAVESVEGASVSSSSSIVEADPVEGSDSSEIQKKISSMTELNTERAYIIFK